MADFNLGRAQGEIALTYNPAGADKAKKDVDSVQKKAEGAGKSFDKVGKTAGIAGAGIAAGLALAVNSAANFQQRLSAIQAVSGATGAQMDAVSKKALQLGKDTKFSASEAAQAIEELVKAGVSLPDALNGAADATVALAAAGEIDLPRAAEIAANAMNVFNLKAKDMPKVADLIAGAANASAIDVEQFAQSLQQSGAAANLAGLSFKDLSVAIALMGNAGIKGSDAGTSLKTMLLNLQPQTEKQIQLFEDLGLAQFDLQKGLKLLSGLGIKPATRDLGGVTEALQKYAAGQAHAKVNSDKAIGAYQKLIRSSGLMSNQFFDETGKAKSLADIAQVLQNALAGMSQEQKLAALNTLFGADAIRASAILAKAGAKGFNDLGAAMGKVKAADVAATRMNNLKGQIEQFKGSAETAAIIVGQQIIPRLTALAKHATNIANAFANLSPQTQHLIVMLLQVAAAMLLFMATTIKVVKFIREFTIAMRAILALKAVAGAIKAIGIAFRFLGAALALNPFVLIVIGLVALGVALVLAYKRSQTFRNIVQKVFQWIKDNVVPIIMAVWRAIVVAFNAIVAAGKVVGAALVTAFKATIGAAKTVGRAISSAFNAVIAVFSAIGRTILAIWTAAFNTLAPVVTTVFKIITTIFRIYFKIIETIVKVALTGIRVAFAVLKSLMPIVTAVLGFIRAYFQLVFAIIKLIVTVYILIIVTAIRAGLFVIKQLWQGVWQTILAFTRVITAVISAVIGAAMAVIRNVIIPVLQAIAAFWNAVWNAIAAVVRAVWGAIRAAVSAGIGAVRAVISAVANGIAAAWSSFWNSRMVGAARNGVNSVINVVKTIARIATEAAQAMARFVTSIANGFINAVRAAAHGLENLIRPFIDLADRFYHAGVEMIASLIRGITSMIDKVKSAVGKVTSAVGRLIPGSPVKEGALVVLNRGQAGKKIVQMIIDGIESQRSHLRDTMAKVAAPVPDVILGVPAALAASASRTSTTALASAQPSGLPTEPLADALADAVTAGLEGARFVIGADGIARIVSRRMANVLQTGAKA